MYSLLCPQKKHAFFLCIFLPKSFFFAFFFYLYEESLFEQGNREISCEKKLCFFCLGNTGLQNSYLVLRWGHGSRWKEIPKRSLATNPSHASSDRISEYSSLGQNCTNFTTFEAHSVEGGFTKTSTTDIKVGEVTTKCLQQSPVQISSPQRVSDMRKKRPPKQRFRSKKKWLKGKWSKFQKFWSVFQERGSKKSGNQIDDTHKMCCFRRSFMF